jgi:excisionase family DNA binding protein
MSRPRESAREAHAVAREVAKLAAKIDGLAVAVAGLRAGQPSKLGRAEEACRLLGISRASLWRGVKAGTIPCERVGRRGIRFDLARLTTTEGART